MCKDGRLPGKIAEFVHLVQVHGVHRILLQEICLDASHEEMPIAKFICIGRMDRSENENRGGIATYVRIDVKSVAE